MHLGIFNYNDGIPINTVIFTEKELDSSNVSIAQNYTSQLISNDHTVTVVLLNSDVDQSNYKLIPGLNIVPWSDPATLLPAIKQNMKCGGGKPVYQPCKTWIAFTPDYSYEVMSNDFKSQMTFISNEIGKLNHPERVLVTDPYHYTISNYGTWYGPFSINRIQSQLPRYSFNYAYNLTFNLQLVYNAYIAPYELLEQTLPQLPISILAFISDTTSPENYVGADKIVSMMKSIRMKLTFVLLGPKADQSVLTNYTNNFVTWKDMSNPQPDNWDQVYLDAYNCPK